MKNDTSVSQSVWFKRLLFAAAGILALNLATIHYPLQVLLPLAEAAYLVLVMFIYGFALLYFAKSRKPASGEESIDFTAAFGLGMMATSLLFFGACFFKILSPWFIIYYYLVPLFLLLFFIKKDSRKSAVMESLTGFFKRPAWEYLVFLFPLVYAALPPSFYDSLAYHLGIPNLYLQNGGFIETPQLFYANAFIYYETSLIPAVFAGDLVPRLFHFLTGVLLILSALDFAQSYFKITKRYIFLLAVVSMPMSIFLLTSIKNDLPSALFILLAIRFFLKDRPYMSFLFWGFALGLKYTNAIPLAIFLLLYFIKSIKEGQTGRFFKHAAILGLITAALLIPALAKNYMYTGNPVFPFFHGLFQNKIQYWDASRFTLLEHDAKKLFNTIGDMLKFPLSISFGELGSGGMVGPLFLMFLPFLIVKREKRLFWLFFALLTLLVGGNFKLSTRVWYLAFILLGVYVTIGYETVKHKLMTVLFFVVVGFNLWNAFGLQEYLYRSYPLLTGKLSAEEYTMETFPTYKAYAYANENLPIDTKILVVGEAAGYYLKRPYRISSGYDYSILRKYLDAASHQGDFNAALKQDGIGYIIFNRFEFRRLQKGYRRLSEADHQKALGFLEYLIPVFKDESNGLYIFQVH